MRAYKVSKTRGGRSKITLYENGMVMLSRTATSSLQATNLGRVWADSDEPVRGVAVEYL